MKSNRNVIRKTENNPNKIEEKVIDLTKKRIKENKKSIGLLLIAASLVVALLLSSCSPDGDNPLTTSNVQNPPTEKTMEATTATPAEIEETTAEETYAEGAVNELITPDDAKELLESGTEVLLLDVRTEAEYVELRIPGSTLLPVEELEDRIDEIAEWKDKTIVVYCRSGNRSNQAAEILQNKGFMIIYDLGGIYDWPFDTESGTTAD